MRTAFIQELIRHARSHPEIFLLVGDLGYSVVEPFAQEFPERFLNAGVAEQNMAGVAAGLASEGYHVFTYSIANFPTLRCLEQIRNDICYHQWPVTVVAVGAGMAYGNLGYSHHAVEDIGVLRGLPNLQIFSPADPGETRGCVQRLVEQPGPSYLRLGKAGEHDLHAVRGVGAAPLPIIKTDHSVALVATGAVLKEALTAAEILATQGQSISVWSCPWLNPVVPADLHHLHSYACVFSLEEHRSATGLGAILRENLPPNVRVIACGVATELASVVGSQEFMRLQAGLDGTTIAKRIAAFLNESA
ncbi:MAG: transketolase C-terminal domain-containing protein [Verrucomicrobiota bacterium]